MVFENLDLASLVNIAKTHTYNRQVAEIIFNDRFTDKPFKIDRKNLNDVNIEIEFNAILSAWKMFGHLITKLQINFNRFEDEQNDQIIKLLKNHPVDALTEFELDFIDIRKVLNDQILDFLFSFDDVDTILREQRAQILIDGIFEFIIRNKNLKQVHVLGGFDDEQFQRIAEELSVLELFDIDFATLTIDDVSKIVCFIETSTKLTEIRLGNVNVDVCQSIQKKIGQKWKRLTREDQCFVLGRQLTN